MLPKLNGYPVVEQMRQREVWTPVLMLTATDGEYDLADAFDLGADDYLTKPSSFVVLVARLRALIRRGGPERPVALRAGDLQLDPGRRWVQRGDTAITLTPREFGLLERRGSPTARCAPSPHAGATTSSESSPSAASCGPCDAQRGMTSGATSRGCLAPAITACSQGARCPARPDRATTPPSRQSSSDNPGRPG